MDYTLLQQLTDYAIASVWPQYPQSLEYTPRPPHWGILLITLCPIGRVSSSRRRYRYPEIVRYIQLTATGIIGDN